MYLLFTYYIIHTCTLSIVHTERVKPNHWNNTVLLVGMAQAMVVKTLKTDSKTKYTLTIPQVITC